MYNAIRPGKFWYDNNGIKIQAHGGSIISADGKFWWYGENKTGITGRATGERCPFWHHGVKLYSSDDLYNWKDEGFAMMESDDTANPFYPAYIMDRPHILYNQKTGLYVMWAKTVKKDWKKCAFSVCVGKDLKSFRYLHDVFPKPFYAGDFDLFEADGKAYVVFESPHTEMVLYELNGDYTGLGERYSSHLKEECPPYVREAPAYFERNGRRYLLTSGTSGYFPNPTLCYDITDLHGEWKEIGDICIGDRERNSFRAQFSSVFLHPSGTYVALADRWLNDLVVDLPDMGEVFLGRCSPRGLKMAEEEFRKLSDENTSEATYVWLPVTFEGDTPKIEWQREWKLK